MIYTNIRLFYLENQSGIKFDLTDINHWLMNPSGLGVEYNLNTVKLGNKLIVTDKEKRDTTISGQMVFTSYAEQLLFSDFISKSTSLKLYYSPPQNEISNFNEKYVYSEIEVTKFDKTEKELNGMLYCDIDMVRLDNWQGAEKITSIVGVEGDGTKIYYETNDAENGAYEYDETLDIENGAYKYSSVDGGNTIEIINSGFVTVPLMITIFGFASKPTITIIDKTTGEDYMKMIIDDILNNATDRFVINSDIEDLYTIKIENGIETNAYSLVDKTEASYLYLPPGTWLINYTNELTDYGNVVVSFTPEYDYV